MNILIVTHFQNDGSPTASFIHEQLKQYVLQGHRVRVLTYIPFLKKDYKSKRFSRIVNRMVIDGVEHYYLRFYSISNYGTKSFNRRMAIFAMLVNRSRIFYDFRPDIIHAHTIGVDSGVASYLKRYFQCPVLVTVHGTDFVAPIKQGYLEAVKRWCNSVDLIVAVSNNLRKKIIDIGISTQVISILNGFDLQHAVYKEPYNKVDYSFIQVGNLVPQKHFDTTIKAFSEIKKIYQAATLTIVGNGLEAERLHQLCRDLCIQDSVKFTGKLANTEVLQLMSEHQFFIMISAPEGFGIVYLEAMASGCITMGTQGQGITELIENGKNGFLVCENDVNAIVNNIKKCIENPEYMNKLSECAKASVNRLSWKDNARNYLHLYEKLITKRNNEN